MDLVIDAVPLPAPSPQPAAGAASPEDAMASFFAALLGLFTPTKPPPQTAPPTANVPRTVEGHPLLERDNPPQFAVNAEPPAPTVEPEPPTHAPPTSPPTSPPTPSVPRTVEGYPLLERDNPPRFAVNAGPPVSTVEPEPPTHAVNAEPPVSTVEPEPPTHAVNAEPTTPTPETPPPTPSAPRTVEAYPLLERDNPPQFAVNAESPTPTVETEPPTMAVGANPPTFERGIEAPAAPPAPAPGGPTTDGAPAEQLAPRLIALRHRPGEHRIEMQLHPRELGTVHLRVTIEADHTIHIELQPEHAAAADVLAADVVALRGELERAGLRTGTLEVDVNAGGTTRDRTGQPAGGGGGAEREGPAGSGGLVDAAARPTHHTRPPRRPDAGRDVDVLL